MITIRTIAGDRTIITHHIGYPIGYSVLMSTVWAYHRPFLDVYLHSRSPGGLANHNISEVEGEAPYLHQDVM